MASKLIILAFLATLMLVDVLGEDDFKELNDLEEEFTELEIEEDEETSDLTRPKRLFRRSRLGGGRVGIRSGGTTSRLGTRFTRTGGTRIGGTTRIGSRVTRIGGGGTRSIRTGGTSRITRIGGRTGGTTRRIGTRIGSRAGGGVRVGTRITRTGSRTGASRIIRLSGSRATRTGAGSSRRLFRTTRQGTGGTGGGSTRRLFRRTRQPSTGGGGEGTGTWGKIGTIVDIASLGTEIVSTTLTLLGSAERKIVISLGNAGGFDWEGYTPYLHEGSSVQTMPSVVETGDAVIFGGVKKSGVSLSGVSGAICYRIKSITKSFCIMFKVPWSGDNYWNVKVYDGEKQATADVYDDLQNGAMKAGTPVTRKDIAEGDQVVDDNGNSQQMPYNIYIKDSSMTGSEQASLTVLLGGELKQGTPKPETVNERSLEFTLRNLEGTGWEGGTIYMNEGASVDGFPSVVDTDDGFRMDIPQNPSSPRTGVSGVVCYKFEELPNSFCVMFKVPYDVGNKWNVRVYNGEKSASLQAYNDLQNGAMDAGNDVTRKDLLQGVAEGTDDDGNVVRISYKVYMKDGSMTSDGVSAMDVSIGIEA